MYEMTYKFYSFIFGAVFLVFFNLACDSSIRSNQQNPKPLIIATTGMVADLARAIGGDSVEVIALMGSGVDPHLYKATQGDLRRLQSADLVLYNGLKLEGKLGEILEKLGNTKPVMAISEQVPDSLLLDDPEYVGNPDPHIWFDVELWSKCIPSVQNALISLDSSKASYFEDRAKTYTDNLTLLHQEVSTAIQQIPEEQRILITAHDAFHYFGRAYGMEVRGLQGISTLSEFGLRDRIDLVNFIVDRKIKAVFVETSVSKKNIRSIIEGCETMGHQVVIGGELFSDAMGEEGTPEGTYIGMVRHNVKQIVESLNP